MSPPVPDRRRLSEEDIAAIVTALEQRQSHVCILDVSPEEVREAVRFMRHFNDLMSNTGSTIWKTVLVVGVGGFLSIMFYGLLAKMKSALGL